MARILQLILIISVFQLVSPFFRIRRKIDFLTSRRRRRPPPPPDPCRSKKGQIGITGRRDIASLRPYIVKWAPLVKLAAGESYRPSSVDFFLNGVTLNKRAYNAHNLPKCNQNCNLQSRTPLGCNSCIIPLFYGENPNENRQSKVPTYVMIRETTSAILDVFYWFFYPYNRGKRVCVGYYLHNFCPCIKSWGHCWCPRITKCIGKFSTFGHHVGDWEYVAVRFRHNRLYSMYLSIHDGEVTRQFGGEFLWNANLQTFVRKDGRRLIMDCTHARVYSSAGSHGLWPNAGNHAYKTLFNNVRLIDSCSDGVNWRTWNNLKIFKYRRDDNYTGEFTFLRFAGRWGNRKSGCGIIEKLSKECMLNGGPGGPQYKGVVKNNQLGK